MADENTTNPANPPIDNNGGGTPGTTPPTDGDWVAPEGFDADMFDENHALKPDTVKARFDADAAKHANLEKQVADLRRKVSNKDALGSEEEYAKGYNNEDFKKHIATDDEKGRFLQATVGNIDKIAKENGLSLAQANAVKDGLFALMQDLGVIDDGDSEERAAAIADVQKSVLGDRAQEIIKENVDWIKEYGLFSDKEKQMLDVAARKGNPLINSVLYKFRALFNKTSSADIPVNDGINDDGLPSDVQLAAEFANPATSDARRVEIVQSRIKAGRTGNLPITAK